MNIYFAWVDASGIYDPDVHTREDEKIFHMEISQKEAGYARARLVVQNPYYGLLWPMNKQYCIISCDKGPLFKGQLLAMPCHVDGELITIDFIASPEDFEAKKQALCQDIMQNGIYDPLFFSQEKPLLKDLLQAYTALSYWDRLTGELCLSDIFRGKKSIDVGGAFIRDSLRIQTVQNPLKRVSVDVSAQWMQQARGAIEVGQHIQKACPQGYLSSLSGKSLEQSWWDKSQRLTLNGYRLENSQLTRLNPENESRFPAASKAYWHKADKPEKVRFPRNWYDVQMRFGWSYKQKRRETASFQLQQKVQPIRVGCDLNKTLSFNLNTIVGKNHLWQPGHVYTRDFKILHNGSVYGCLRRHTTGEAFDPSKWQLIRNLTHVDSQASRSEFFKTSRGQKAIGYALEVAKAHLAASARCIQVSFRAPWDDLTSVTLNHNIKLVDDRLPGGAVTGKVLAYAFVADGASGEKIVEVKLGVSAGEGVSTTEPFSPASAYMVEDYAEQDLSATGDVYERSASALCFRIAESQEPLMGICRPAALSEYDLIQQIEVIDDAVSQEQVLQQHQFPHGSDLKKALQKRPTNLKIKLKDLRTYGCLERRVHVDVLTVWSAPKHIDLRASRNRDLSHAL